MKVFLRRGFTLVELMIVITLIGILSAVLLANMMNSGKIGRDTERKSDLRNLQTAIEAYRHKYAKYPDMGCPDTNSNGFSDEADDGCSTYIKNLAPEFIDRLPHDPARGLKVGYAYITNPADPISGKYAANLAFKIMAINTVEADTLTYTHPFKSCDVRPNSVGAFQYSTSNSINVGGWCSYVINTDGDPLGDVPQCKLKSDNGGGRFDKSYGLWGGYVTGGSANATAVAPTTDVICK